MGINKTFSGINRSRYWSELSYAGMTRVPVPLDPEAGSWPLFFLKRNMQGEFTDPAGKVIPFSIQYPDSGIDFEGEQLDSVRQVLQNLTPEQIDMAHYWGSGPPTKQFTPIIDRLLDTYELSAARAARVLAAAQAGINDAFVVCWHFKYLWNIARPNQLDQELATLLCTPNHPSYPSGHSTVAGCLEAILSYFFPPEAPRLHELAEECALSRLYAGVHFPVDNSEGLRLGRQIGGIIVEILANQASNSATRIDHEITENRHAQLPPPYRQVIPFEYSIDCDSKVIPPVAPVSKKHSFGYKAKTYYKGKTTAEHRK